MDEDEINNLVQACKLLKYKFRGVFAADNFHVNLFHNSFIIVMFQPLSELEHIGHFFVGEREKIFLLIHLDKI